MARKLTPSAWRNKCDKLFSEIIRAQGYCENCHDREDLQCAHIVSRSYKRTRCYPPNAFCLCAGCHMYFTHWPLEFATFVIAKIGEKNYDRLKRLARDTTVKVRWDEVYEELCEIRRLQPGRDV